MATKHDVRSQLARVGAELKEMAAKTEAEGFDNARFVALQALIKTLKEQLANIELAEEIHRGMAEPAGDGSGGAVKPIRAPAEARKRYSKLKAFKDHTDEHGQLVRSEDDAYGVGQWLKAQLFRHKGAEQWCREHGLMVTRAQSEEVDSAGGFLVPEQMMASIIDLREQYGVFRQECTIVPMGRDTVNWPRRTGGLTAYFVGENTVVTESNASWDNINLTAKKLGVLTRFSTELDEDAVISIADWLTNEIAYAMSVKEDDCGFNGDGSSTYGGIRGLTVWGADPTTTAGQVAAASGHPAFSNIDQSDLTKLMGILPQYALPGAKFYCSQVAFAQVFERLIATAGGNTINTLDGKIIFQYLGFPITISQKMPLTTGSLNGKVMLAFGDLRLAAAMGERRQVTVRRSDERYFDQDQIGLLATERVDINVHDVGTTTQAGPLVFLLGTT